jgi:coenzyme F420-0:L-glutamate ligase / coenzyme F420-1:gamma-L-glutamate ligase
LEILPITVPTKKNAFDLFESLVVSGFEFRENDILVISSKYVSVAEGCVIDLSQVKVSKKARSIASKYHVNPKIAELVIRESDYIFNGIPGFLLAIRAGIMAPNAGIDKSNVPSGFAILYPRQPFKSAESLRRKFLVDLGIRIGVVLADSRLMPTRIGTTGVAIANAGFEPIEDQRGRIDLFGNVLKVTFKAVADSLATMGVAVMGESNESIPAVVVRGAKVIATNRKLSYYDMAVDPLEDIYVRGFMH